MSSFIDQATLQVRSGDGGGGMVHFLREKFIAQGGPDGGDGGKGGDVIFVVNPKLNTLFHLRQKNRYLGETGVNGGIRNRTGRSGADLVIPVPAGTILFDDTTDEVIGDLTDPNQTLIVCVGGRGGRGNARFKNSRNQTPRLAEGGEPGTERTIRLELKLIADIGLVGVPNAGKSTFLAAVTNARPKIADYPFTTLVPNLGVAILDQDTELILADIPGLIEGAHTGVGLGHDFLRHIQRTRVLIHLLDGMAEDPIADLIQITAELSLFDPALADKPQIIVLNKLDLPDVQERREEILGKVTELGYESMAISAVAGTDVRSLLYRAHQLLADAPMPEAPEGLPVFRLDVDPRTFEIEKLHPGYRVKGASIERAAAMTYWDYDQSARRFQKILETLGIDEALREAGIKEGDIVQIGTTELEWSD
jgi:GTP-binding protein